MLGFSIGWPPPVLTPFLESSSCGLNCWKTLNKNNLPLTIKTTQRFPRFFVVNRSLNYLRDYVCCYLLLDKHLIDYHFLLVKYIFDNAYETISIINFFTEIDVFYAKSIYSIFFVIFVVFFFGFSIKLGHKCDNIMQNSIESKFIFYLNYQTMFSNWNAFQKEQQQSVKLGTRCTAHHPHHRHCHHYCHYYYKYYVLYL